MDDATRLLAEMHATIERDADATPGLEHGGRGYGGYDGGGRRL